MPLTLSDFQYQLPQRLIAQIPAQNRDASRLMIVDKRKSRLGHRKFSDLPRYLRSGDVLIMNDVRVIPARLRAVRATGGRVEILVLNGWHGGATRVLLRPARRIQTGEELILPDQWRLKIVAKDTDAYTGMFSGNGSLLEFMEKHGEMPVPPYIQRKLSDVRFSLDRQRYQTVYAKEPGAVAAPTAGLHFTDELLNKITSMNITVLSLTLFVGWGTFKPVKCEVISEHHMEKEGYRIPLQTAQQIKNAKSEDRRIIAVGTTAVRALECWALQFPDLTPVSFAEADCFIYPGYRFKIIDGMVTNFHLPGSTLIMLVSALAGREKILHAYDIAVKKNYRFYSYGDAMLIT